MRFVLLDPLRGVAALWVFFFHLGLSADFQRTLPWLYRILQHGELGIPMFFVISGFCIEAAAQKTLLTGRTSSDFLKRRVWRIYPPFWCSIAVTAAVPFVIEYLSSLKSGTYVPPSRDHLNYGYLSYSFLDWIRVATLSQVFAYVPAATSLQYKFTTINAVYWTLAIEVQFYLAMTAAVSTGRYYARTIVLITALGICSQWLPGAELTGLFLPYWPMFAVGIATYHVSNHLDLLTLQSGHRIRWAASVIGIGLTVGLITSLIRGVSPKHLAFALGFGTFLLALKVFDEDYATFCVGSRVRALRLASWLAGVIGAMSYSLYLLHGRLRFLAMQPLRQVLPVDSIAFDLTVVLLTSLMCYAFYVCCERPFIIGRRARKGSSLSVPANQ